MPDALIHKAFTIVNVCMDIKEMVYTHAQVYIYKYFYSQSNLSSTTLE